MTVDGQTAMTVALRLLTGRSLSRAELERRLRQRHFDAAAIADAIDTCVRCGYLDDNRTAKERVESMVRRGYGPHRIRQALAQLGLAEGQADLLLTGRLPPEEEMRLARLLLDKKGIRRPPGDAQRRLRARDYRFLLQRGFSAEVAARAAQSDGAAAEA